MKKSSIYIGIIFSLIMTGLIFILGFDRKNYMDYPSKLYQVYLDGEVIGVIDNKKELYNLIDKEQNHLKDKYSVDKIYPPNGLEIMPIVTYEGHVDSSKVIYDKMKDKDPFTVKGYKVTITKNKKTTTDEVDTTPVTQTLYILHEADFNAAVENTAKAFLTEEEIKAYKDKKQTPITNTGKFIDNISLKENVTIKETYISTSDKILSSPEEISRYLLFGTLETQATYTVSSGDTISALAQANSLSVEEFLIANPEIKSATSLLFPGQVVKIGLIKPAVDVSVQTTVVENQTVTYATKIKYDNSLIRGTSYVEQEGSNGVSKVKFKIDTVNGAMLSVDRVSAEEITPAVDKIIVKGGLEINYVGDSGYWGWPTIKPYVITSYRGWRWGEWHTGIDIAGVGSGSPVYSIQSGTIVECGFNRSMGNYVYVWHEAQFTSVYMHMSAFSSNTRKGASVAKGQILGAVGSTGNSSGPHLHLSVYANGLPYRGGQEIDPLALYK
ncbi:MAG: M23 family metallopeptidase [Bacilli bacterium]